MYFGILFLHSKSLFALSLTGDPGRLFSRFLLDQDLCGKNHNIRFLESAQDAVFCGHSKRDGIIPGENRVYAPYLQNCLKRVEKPGSCFHFDLFPFVI